MYNFGIEDVNLNTLDRIIDEINSKFGYRSELAIFSCAVARELQKVAYEIRDKKLKLKTKL